VTTASSRHRTSQNWTATMTSAQLRKLIKQADDLLNRADLPPKERIRVAGLKLLDQKMLALRQKHPELDKEGAA